MTAIEGPLKISWKDNLLSVTRSDLPSGRIDIHYLEAFCRAASHDCDWGDTVIPHETALLSVNDESTQLHLESRLVDGTVVSHSITASRDAIDFHLTAHNETDRDSAVHWAQPCIRVGAFTGLMDAAHEYDYLRKCFVFLDHELTRMPTSGWGTTARYTPGQVWCPASVPRTDVNPRPLNSQIPSNGLIGCFSQDESILLATAWEPYQELFQGICQCIHSDFRIGGLRPGESKEIRGRIYLLRGGVGTLIERYERDFPEHVTGGGEQSVARRRSQPRA